MVFFVRVRARNGSRLYYWPNSINSIDAAHTATFTHRPDPDIQSKSMVRQASFVSLQLKILLSLVEKKSDKFARLNLHVGRLRRELTDSMYELLIYEEYWVHVKIKQDEGCHLA